MRFAGRSRLVVGLLILSGATAQAVETIEDVEKAVRAAWATQTGLEADLTMTSQFPVGEELVPLTGKGTTAYLRSGDRDLYRQEITLQLPQPLTMEIKNFIVYDGNYLYITNEAMGRQDTLRDRPNLESGNVPPGGALLFEVLHEFVDIARKPDSTVDGRGTYVVEGVPKAQYKEKAGFARALFYLDRETGFLMKTELFESGASPVAVVEARNLRVSSTLTPEQFKAPADFSE